MPQMVSSAPRTSAQASTLCKAVGVWEKEMCGSTSPRFGVKCWCPLQSSQVEASDTDSASAASLPPLTDADGDLGEHLLQLGVALRGCSGGAEVGGLDAVQPRRLLHRRRHVVGQRLIAAGNGRYRAGSTIVHSCVSDNMRPALAPMRTCDVASVALMGRNVALQSPLQSPYKPVVRAAVKGESGAVCETRMGRGQHWQSSGHMRAASLPLP